MEQWMERWNRREREAPKEKRLRGNRNMDRGCQRVRGEEEKEEKIVEERKEEETEERMVSEALEQKREKKGSHQSIKCIGLLPFCFG